MKKKLLSIFFAILIILLPLTVSADTQDLIFSWTPPTEYVSSLDCTKSIKPIGQDDIILYEFFYKIDNGEWQKVEVDIPTYTIQDVSEGSSVDVYVMAKKPGEVAICPTDIITESVPISVPGTCNNLHKVD